MGRNKAHVLLHMVNKQGRVTGAMGLPVPEHRPGDCYVWGSSNPNIGSSLSQVSISHRQHCAYPAIVDESTHLDVHQVCACLSILLHMLPYIYNCGTLRCIF